MGACSFTVLISVSSKLFVTASLGLWWFELKHLPRNPFLGTGCKQKQSQIPNTPTQNLERPLKDCYHEFSQKKHKWKMKKSFGTRHLHWEQEVLDGGGCCFLVVFFFGLLRFVASFMIRMRTSGVEDLWLYCCCNLLLLLLWRSSLGLLCRSMLNLPDVLRSSK